MKPCRPAPPPPSPQRPSVSQPSTVQHVSSLTPALSAAPLPSTRQTDPPSQAFAPLLLPEAHPATQAPQTAPPLSTAPLALPFPALETCPLFQTPPAQSTQVINNRYYFYNVHKDVFGSTRKIVGLCVTAWGRLYKTLNHFFNHYFVIK